MKEEAALTAGKAPKRPPPGFPMVSTSDVRNLPTDSQAWDAGVGQLLSRSLFQIAIPCPLAHRQTMQSHELLREVFQTTSAKQVAADLNLSLSMIYKWAEPEDGTGSGATNPLDRIEALLRSTKDIRIVQWLCQRAGGFFILNPKISKPHPEFLIPATNEIVQEFADLLAVIANAAADNEITEREAKSIRARWEELKSVTERFVACCEDGSFAKLKEERPS